MTLLAGLQDPAYTGANRCLPCTVVNAAIAVVLAAAVAWLVAAASSTTFGAGAGLTTLAIAAGAIYLKGYLVPGTPTLTRRYLPEWVLRAFGKAPDQTEGVTAPEAAAGSQGAFDVETALLEAGALEPCADRADLCPTEAFSAAWQTALESDTADRDALVTRLGLEPGDITIEDHGDAFRALRDGREVGLWPSAAAYRADLASADALTDLVADWDELPPAQRAQLVTGMRLFVESCPECGTTPTFGTEEVASCCREYQVAAVTCDGCGSRLFESGAL